MQKPTNTAESLLDMSLEELGFTPRTGSPLLVFVNENTETFEFTATMPIRCSDACETCGGKNSNCRKHLHHLPKMTARRVLSKWKRYYEKHVSRLGKLRTQVHNFLIPSLRKLLETLIERGLSADFIKAQIPFYEKILA